MSDVKHTPEPWSYTRFVIYGGNGGEICSGAVEANARRIVACVNACAGLPTKALEQMVANGNRLAAADFIVDAMDRQIEQAEQQRDQLLEALEYISRFIDPTATDGESMVGRAKAAIAAVKGGA